MNKRAQYAYEYYVRRGVPPAVAAGIVGNLYVESGGFSDAVIAGTRRGDNGSAWYAPQLRGVRKSNYEAFAAKQGMNPATLDAQLAFVLEELDPKSPYRDPIAAKNRNAIFAATTPDDAAGLFSKYYERPGTPHLGRRQHVARSLGGAPSQMLPQAPAPLTTAEANAAGDFVGSPLLPGQGQTPSAQPRGMAALAPNGLKGGWTEAGNFVARGPQSVNPQLVELLKLAAEQTPGYRVEAFSGYRPGDRRFHGKGKAVDVRLYDAATNKMLPNYQDAAAFRQYEKFAQTVRTVQMERFPELAQDLRWGGYFSGQPGVYGAVDTMHFDLGGRKAGMRGGSGRPA